MMHETVIPAQERVIQPRPFSAIKLAAFWVVAIFIPCLMLQQYLGTMALREEESAENEAKLNLSRELDLFKSDLQGENYLGSAMKRANALAEFDRSAGVAFDEKSMLQKLHAAIHRTLGRTPLLLVIIGSGLQEIAFTFHEKSSKAKNPPSRRILLNVMRLLSEQETARKSTETSKSQQSLSFLQSLLGIPFWPELPENAPRLIYSNKYDGRNLYLYCHFTGTGDERRGYFLVFPDWEIPPIAIIRSAQENSRDPELRRQVVLKPKGKALINARLMRTRAGLALESFPPPVLMKLFEKTSNNRMPMLKVSSRFRQQPLRLRKLIPLFNLGFCALGFFSAITLIRLALSGELLAVSLRWKMLLAISFASGLPLVGLWIAFGEYSRTFSQLQGQKVREHLTQTLVKLESDIHAFNSIRDRQIRRLKEAVGKALKSRPQKVSGILKKGAKRGLFTFALVIDQDFQATPCLGLDVTGLESIDRTDQLMRCLNPIAMKFFTKLGFIDKAREEELNRHLSRDAYGMFYSQGITDLDVNMILAVSGKTFPVTPPGQTLLKAQVFLLEGAGGKRVLFFLFKNPEVVAEQYFHFLAMGKGGYRISEPDYDIRSAVYRYAGHEVLSLMRNKSWPLDANQLPEFADLCRKALKDGRPGYDRLREKDGWFQAYRPFADVPFVASAIGRLQTGKNLQLVDPKEFFLYFALLMLLSAGFLSRTFEKPLEWLIMGIRRIRGGDLRPSQPLFTGDEFEMFSSECRSMARALLERERMSRFMSALTISSATVTEAEATFRTEVSVLFSHIRDFTELSEKHSPEIIVELLNGYFAEMEKVILSEGGVIDKFIGDAVMAVFHPSGAGSDHPFKACRAAMGMKQVLDDLNRRRQSSGEFSIQTGIGIATGSVIEGRIGSSIGRVDHTFIGDTVNVAARLATLSVQSLHQGVLITFETAARVGTRVPQRLFGSEMLKGKTEAIQVFEIARLDL